jgi:hypothetical protein
MKPMGSHGNCLWLFLMEMKVFTRVSDSYKVMTTAVRFYGFQDMNMHSWWIWIETMCGICVIFNI